MDPLSDVLRVVRLDGAYFYAVEATEPWSVRAVPAKELTPRLLPHAEHLISYHILTEGRCWGGRARRGAGGDAAGRRDRLPARRCAPHVEPARASTSRTTATAPRPIAIPTPSTSGAAAAPPRRSSAASSAATSAPSTRSLATLPRRLHVRGLSQGWLSLFARQVVEESRADRAGADTVLTRLAELMFIEVLRRHLETITPEQTGWLAGLRDPMVGKALGLLHARPAHAWTLDELAREVASSRSKFAERFTWLVGEPPMQYLAKWRMQLAANQLAQGSEKVAAVASAVGYESEAAFSRAFKKATGVSPAAWRQVRRAVTPGASSAAAP